MLRKKAKLYILMDWAAEDDRLIQELIAGFGLKRLEEK